MGVKSTRQQYIRSKIIEFKEKGFSLDNISKGKDLYRFANNKKSFEKFKKDLQKERAYQTERQKVVVDYEKIVRDRQLGLERKQKQQLSKTYNPYNSEEGKKRVGTIWLQRDELGLKNLDYYSPTRLQNKLLEKFKDDTFNQITMKNYNTGELKDFGAFFKNVKDDKYMEKYFSALFKKIENDKLAMVNIYKAIDYLYGELLYELYESEGATYNKNTNRGGDQHKFWRTVGKKLNDYYEKIMVKNFDDEEV